MKATGDDASARRVLDEAGGVRAMTWVMAIMIFLTLLAAAFGLATWGAARDLDRQVAGRLTVQLVAPDGRARDRLAGRVAERLRRLPEVSRVAPVPRAELSRLLEPWLGEDAGNGALPVPALIDVDLARDDDAAAARVAAAVRTVAPAARVDRHESWMAPVERLADLLTALAAALVALMVAATLAVVVLAVRSGLEVHRGTIEVMHMLGSTDVQVARLFQRRIALDAAFGGGVGALVALGVALLIGERVRALGSELLGGAALGRSDWAALALLVPAFVLLATLAARRAVLAELKRTL